MIYLETSGNERGMFAREIKRVFVQKDLSKCWKGAQNILMVAEEHF